VMVRLLVLLGRLAGLGGAALTVGAVSAMVVGWAYSAVRHAPDWNVGLLPVVLPLQLLVAGWVAWGALGAEPRALLRRLLVAAAVSFFAFYGWYFLLGGDGAGLIGVGNLLYLGAGLLVGIAARTPTTVGDSGDRASPGINARALGAVAFAAIAAATGYGVASASPGESGEVPSKDDLPPLSCPEYLGDEVASFGGSGDRVSPEFEVEPGWGYEYNSWGYGALRMAVVDEGGQALYDEEDAPPSPVGSTGGGEYASGGAYRLEIDADDEANYEMLVCDGATRSGTG
jgi:hypothetical protein